MMEEKKMKKIIIPILTAALGLTSCDFLNLTPKDKLAPENYFRNEQDLKLFSNSFYDNLFNKTPYDLQSDIIFQKGTLSDELLGGSARQIPNDAGKGGWSWGQLRKINTMLGNIDKCPDKDVVARYTGLARFFRARFYFEKVKRFGDVPWYDRELGSTDADLMNPRDSRVFVIAKVLEDINFAIDNLPEDKTTYRVNRYAALMLKAQICLYEGTYRKYHGVQASEGPSVSELLTMAAEAAKEVMNGPYKLFPDYGELFRKPDADPDEYILAIRMEQAIGCVHSATSYAIMNTGGNPGFSKKFIDSFLMKDGKRYTDQAGWETKQFVDEVKDRDPRLGAIIRLPEHVRTTTQRTVYGPEIAITSTGFHMDKFVMDGKYVTAERANMSFNDMPVYRLAEAYLIYAEAKAELGSFTQDDADISVNLLRDRVGMPHMNVSSLTVDPFLTSKEYGYPHLASLAPANLAVLLEIRRERTIELCLESSNRWDDLVRWKEGKNIEQPLLGMYFPGPGEYDITGDGDPDICLYNTSRAPEEKKNKNGVIIAAMQIQEIEIDGRYVPYSDGLVLSEGDHGFIEMHRTKTRSFDESRDYLYPIPIGDRRLNESLTQNPGWNDGIVSGEDADTGENK